MFAVSEIISKYDWTVTILARFHPRNSYFFFDKLNSIIVYEYISNCETVFLINKFLFLTRSSIIIIIIHSVSPICYYLIPLISITSKRPNSLRIVIKCGKYWFIRIYTFWLVTTVTCLYKQIDAS